MPIAYTPPSRDPELDAFPGFRLPPPGYGEVPFYWWLGDKLEKERLLWQLDQLAVSGVSGVQINYAHSDQGGLLWGLTYPSDPPLFSSEWWELFNWFRREAHARGLSVSLSDYTLGMAGQGWYFDEILAEEPEICGSRLEPFSQELTDGAVDMAVPEGTLCLWAYRLCRGQPKADGAVDLLRIAYGGRVLWSAPQKGSWCVLGVVSRRVPRSLDPMHPHAGSQVIAKFFQRFVDKSGGLGSGGLNFFFSDELNFGVSGNMWNQFLRQAFIQRKGYDPLPHLPALFWDIGDTAPKLRLDYRDVMVQLSEEHYFEPIYKWHEDRGMVYGCDHGGRGRDLTEFGDYFRTQKWNQGPGCDQPHLQSNLIKNKVASSISHLYERPRTWLEGFYGSGWGTSSAQVADALFRNFAMGHNLLSLHGLYYSTHGGFWEWAPPCNHFRMPYWGHFKEFLRCSERLSYLLSQGLHRCDVALVYPIAAIEAGMEGPRSDQPRPGIEPLAWSPGVPRTDGGAVSVAFAAAEALYSQGVDFDFMDFHSLERSFCADGELRVAGERYRVLVLPSMRAVRFGMLAKVLDFFRSGGIVLCIGDLPEASDRAGCRDETLDGMVRELFGRSCRDPAAGSISVKRGERGGVGCALSAPESIGGILRDLLVPDFSWDSAPAVSGTAASGNGMRVVGSPGAVDGGAVDGGAAARGTPASDLPVYFQHRRIGPRDLYLVYGLPRGTVCSFRCSGTAELWDPWTGSSTPLAQEEGPGAAGSASQSAGPDALARIKLPLGPDELHLIVFDPRIKPDASTPPALGSSGAAAPYVIPLDDDWDFELMPTLDNRWGDFRLPASPGLLGAELHALKYAEETEASGDAEDAALPTARTGVAEDAHLPTAMAGAAGKSAAPAWTDPAWANPAFDDSQWERALCSYGPFFHILGPLPATADGQALGLAMASGGDPAGQGITLEGKSYQWKPYSYSPRHGVFGDPGHQGYHGLKCQISDDFIVLGKKREIMTDTVYDAEAEGTVYLMATHVVAPTACRAVIKIGAMAPEAIWVNGEPITPESGAALQPGANSVLLLFTRPGKTYVVFESPFAGDCSGEGEHYPRPLSMSWYGKPGVLPFAYRGDRKRPAQWYRFTAPPGVQALSFTAVGTPKVWADGRPAECERSRGVDAPGAMVSARAGNPPPADCGAAEYTCTFPEPIPHSALIAIRLDGASPAGGSASAADARSQNTREQNSYAGAALSEPIRFDCGAGRLAPGDWSLIDGLAAYSGGAWYRRTFRLDRRAKGSRVVLDLGRVVSSAEVRINGSVAAIRVAPPWTADLTPHVLPGENSLEILVCSTLGNYYSTIPTRYGGETTAGLLGPVAVKVYGA